MAKTVLITGEGGIGHALAKEFHSQGHRVFATSRTLESMQTLKDLGVETFTLDVTDSSSIQGMKTRISELTDGSLDILVNNAGISYQQAVSDFSMDRVRQIFNVNVFGAMEMAQTFIPLLVQSGDARIVQTGSLSGLMPVPFNATYSSSKAALHAFGDTMRVELAPFGIKVLNVCAGTVESNIVKEEPLPPNSLYGPIEKEYETAISVGFREGRIPASNFAQTVVSEILKKTPKAWLWAGHHSWRVWLIHTFGNRTGFDAILSDIFGISKLLKIRKEGKK